MGHLELQNSLQKTDQNPNANPPCGVLHIQKPPLRKIPNCFEPLSGVNPKWRKHQLLPCLRSWILIWTSTTDFTNTVNNQIIRIGSNGSRNPVASKGNILSIFGEFKGMGAFAMDIACFSSIPFLQRKINHPKVVLKYIFRSSILAPHPFYIGVPTSCFPHRCSHLH